MDIDGGGSDNDSYVSDAASYASVDCFEDDYDYKESCSSSDEEDAGETFKRRLTTWAVEANIARCHVNSLLKLLKTDGGLGYLPVDWRTLASDRKILLIENILRNSNSEVFILAKQFRNYNNLFEYPLPSMAINEFFVSDLSHDLQIWPISCIINKCLRIPMKNPPDDSFFVSPLFAHE